jgi:hypothetical protein
MRVSIPGILTRSRLVVLLTDDVWQPGLLYLTVLEQEVPKCSIPDRVVMQANASIHNAKKVQK